MLEGRGTANLFREMTRSESKAILIRLAKFMSSFTSLRMAGFGSISKKRKFNEKT